LNELIEELKAEHKILLNILDNINKSGIGTQEGRMTLLTAKTTLLEHLKKEDTALYPVLWQGAAKDFNLKESLQLFASDMNKISANAIHFFDKYKEGDSGITFASDYGTLLGTLRIRIRREEEILYNEYQKLTAPRKPQ